MALVGDEDATAVRGREWYSAGGRVAGSDEDVAVDRTVAVAIAQASDLGIGHPPTEAFEPLFHEHPRRHDDQREQASMYGIVDRREGDVGLARPGDRLDHPAAATSVPRHQGVVLEAVEVVRQGRQATTPAPGNSRSGGVVAQFGQDLLGVLPDDPDERAEFRLGRGEGSRWSRLEARSRRSGDPTRR